MQPHTVFSICSKWSCDECSAAGIWHVCVCVCSSSSSVGLSYCLFHLAWTHNCLASLPIPERTHLSNSSATCNVCCEAGATDLFLPNISPLAWRTTTKEKSRWEGKKVQRQQRGEKQEKRMEENFSHATSPGYHQNNYWLWPWILALYIIYIRCGMNSWVLNAWVLFCCFSDTRYDLQLFQQITLSHTEVSILSH